MVDLPEPDGPIKAKYSPLLIIRSTPLRACTSTSPILKNLQNAENEKEIFSYNEFIGDGTNNEAEYRAIIEALKLAIKSDWFGQNNSASEEIVCRLDSQLVVEQINGRYKIKQPHIQVFIDEIREILKKFNIKISFIHIRREQNKRADQLVNEVLDKELKNKAF